MTYEQFQQAVEDAGLTPKWCDYQHWQILGGQHVVNFYPDTRRGDRFYVNRAEHGTGGTLERALRAAKDEIQFPMLPEQRGRGKNHKAKPEPIHGEIQSRWRQHKKSGGKLTLEQFAERAAKRDRNEMQSIDKATRRKLAERIYSDLPDGAFFAAAESEFGLDPEDFIE